MNERIRLLEQQALSIVLNGNDPDGDVDKMYVPSEFTKKFAELIVRECAEVARSNTRVDIKVYLMIQEHFGVEL